MALIPIVEKTSLELRIVRAETKQERDDQFTKNFS